jgi:ABC-2 type transport system ATP-binding protein
MNVIELLNLTKTYSRSHLGKTTLSRGVESLSLNVRQGEVFGLLGLNGSGKTTTIKLILGLLKATGGSARVFDRPVPSNDVLRRIGYLPEVPSFYRYLTAREILKLYGELSEIENVEQKVSDMLKIVGLEPRADSRLSTFSKGMLQRVGLAQSLLHGPDLLIYDEPVSGLDPLAIAQMRSLIAALKEKGKTVFLSSHMISEVEKLCDRVGILVQGKLTKVLEQKDWQEKEGGLERIFVGEVSASAETGSINYI